ncbi:NEDD4-binding protein 2 [Asbolus verrucosus]|uniref:NEDD4-binding protein 2 n=1 Tax=Asbolus verrucosus TaxID=1661398 RepID=A0A482VRX1_ASBVE|nr:NEDD4-binding protein 2 [Asbolus verrucosus]
MRRKQNESVVNNLKGIFDTLSVDIIRSVASHCNFDVEKSMNALLEMTNRIEGQPTKKKEKNKVKKASPQHTTPKKTEPNPSPRSQPSPNIVVNKSKKTLDLERVVKNIRQGYKVLVILRGLPGSGKSRLAVAITDVALGPGNNSNHILSTDDFFVQQRGYLFDPQRLQEAHEWNHRRAFQAMSRGFSPVIIDNTNTQMWEMKPYAMMATDYGYMIEILEPDTWWCFNEKELAKRNVHGVPRAKIKDMLERYERNVTPQKLLCAYNLVYKFQKPPQLRLFPPIIQSGFGLQRQNGFVFNFQPQVDGVVKSKSTSALNRQNSIEIDQRMETINLMDFTEEVAGQSAKAESDNRECFIADPVDEILMCTEENTASILQPDQVNEEPPKLFRNMENAWGVDEKALQSWDIVTPITCEAGALIPHSSNSEEESKPETKDGSSNVEISDFLSDKSEVPAGLRVVVARGRDINLGLPLRTFSVPKKTMVDQSCITEDLVENEGKSEESRIKDLLDLFPRIPRSSLQELFNKCNKNFHWTVDLLLEDNHLEMSDQKEEEEEEEKKEEPIEIDDSDEEEPKEEIRRAPMFKRKIISDDCLELKKCLEEKIDINKEHYSEHVLRVKQSKFGGYQEPQPSTSAPIDYDSDMDSDGCYDQSDDNPKNMIELNLGNVFVDQLETMFGGDDDAFPKGFQPVVQMPVTLARQIYSFYVESICQQMEAQNHILERLVKEDEDFARKLQSQEETVPPPRPPNLNEIMDEEVAMNLHRREVEEWKNMTADNLAARLTKQKLFNTFPNIDRESLLEILHAYNYDYNKTVSDLITSVGPEHVNGFSETIKEPPLSTTTIQEMKEAEENCVDFEESEEQHPATYYREEANKHLTKREQLYEKARNYFHRGMTEVAMFYSELAKKETKSYDKANHIAAAAFIDEHAKRLQKFDTLDLHYFYVKEAIPNLDIFIDRNINLLKGGSKQCQDLFVITGRGKNSEGGRCKIKPAVISRLKKRKISFVQLNPGLLKIKVKENSLMTSDLP